MDKQPVDAKLETDIDNKSETAYSLQRLVDDIQSRLNDDKKIRRTVPNDGRLRIDRALPFLCVYRNPPDVSDIGTSELVTTEASYLYASGDATTHPDLVEICRTVRDASIERFNAFLLIEIWSEDLSTPDRQSSAMLHPAFRVNVPDDETLATTIKTFEEALGKINFSETYASVDVVQTDSSGPSEFEPLLPNCEVSGARCYSIGLAVHPVYRNLDGDILFPIVLQRMRRQLAVAIRKLLFTFTRDVLESAPKHYQALGPTALVQAASLVDQQLCDVSVSFDYLLQITPVNSSAAWEEFQGNRFKRAPRFYYRPLPRNPAELKRSLFDVPIDRIEDPTLAELFWEKQDELDHQITSLRVVDTSQFLYSSLQLYGDVEPELRTLAEKLLDADDFLETEMADVPDDSENDSEFVYCDELVARAQEEVAWYRERDSNFHASVQRRNDIAAGIMVSNDTVLIAENVKVHRARVEGLMHHEIGTHLLTYFNGRRQPFQQLYAGLAGYESFQEGIAVLAEYLVGGLTSSRIRTLAARVVASDMLVQGGTFVDTFERLCDQYQFNQKSAFKITTRIFRGGGTTKDAVYLRGLRDVLNYVSTCDGIDVDRMFVGKISLSHIDAINDLMRRGIINSPSLLPRYLEMDCAQLLLKNCIGKDVSEILLGPKANDS